MSDPTNPQPPGGAAPADPPPGTQPYGQPPSYGAPPPHGQPPQTQRPAAPAYGGPPPPPPQYPGGLTPEEITWGCAAHWSALVASVDRRWPSSAR